MVSFLSTEEEPVLTHFCAHCSAWRLGLSSSDALGCPLGVGESDLTEEQLRRDWASQSTTVPFPASSAGGLGGLGGGRTGHEMESKRQVSGSEGKYSS